MDDPTQRCDGLDRMDEPKQPLAPSASGPGAPADANHTATTSSARSVVPPVIAEDQKTVISRSPPVGLPEKPLRLSHAEHVARQLTGERLGHFQLEEFIGGGGMGAVFRATDTALGRTVAVKVVSGASHDEEALRRFKNEAQSAARLDHPNIARVYYVGEDRGWHYIVFEYVQGVNIRDLVVQRGPLPIDDVILYSYQVAAALDHASQRDVVHRDIKPSNVLVTADGRVKLVDMGLARLQQVDTTDELTASGVTLGTFDYISPEQARDPRSADVRSDLYSLGCTIFFMLTGRPPFPDGTVLQKLLSHSSEPPPDPRQFRDDIPDALAALVLRLLAKNPNDRYQTPKEVAGQLKLLADQLGVVWRGVEPTLVIAPVTWPKGRGELVPWLAAFVAVIMLAFVIHVFSGSPYVTIARPNLAPASPPSENTRPSSTSPAPNGSGAQQNTAIGGARGLSEVSGTARQGESTAPARSPASGEVAPTVVTAPGIAGSPSSVASPPPGATPSIGPETSALSPGVPPSNTALGPGTNATGGSTPMSSQAVTGAASVEGPSARAPTNAVAGGSSPPVTAANGAGPSAAEGGGSRGATNPPIPQPTLPDRSLVRRLVVAPSPVATLPGDAVWVSSLQSALERAGEFDHLEAVELWFDGPLVLAPCQITGIDHLVIRAGSGFQPILWFKPELEVLGAQRRMILVRGGNVVWTGIHAVLELPDEPAQDWCIFALEDVQSFELQGASFTFINGQPAARRHEGVAMFEVLPPRPRPRMDMEMTMGTTPMVSMRLPPVIRLESVAVRGQASLLRLPAAQPLHLMWHNGLFISNERLLEIGGTSDSFNWDAELQIQLDHVTAVIEQGLARVQLDNNAPKLLDTNLELNDCILLTSADVPLLDYRGVSSIERAEKSLKFRGDGNFYPTRILALSPGRLTRRIRWRITTQAGQSREYGFDQKDAEWYEEKSAKETVLWKEMPPSFSELPPHRHMKSQYELDSSFRNPARTAGLDGQTLPEFPLLRPTASTPDDNAP